MRVSTYIPTTCRRWWYAVIHPYLVDIHYPTTITDIRSEASDPTCTPLWWSLGDTVDLYLARSGAQVRVAAPALHCEANFSGGVDDSDPDSFTAWLPFDCLDCDYYITGTVTGDQLTADAASSAAIEAQVISIAVAISVVISP